MTRAGKASQSDAPAARGSWRSTLTSRWVLLSVASLCYWTATQALKPMVALRLQDLGSSDALIGIVLGAHSLVTFAIALPSGRSIDRYGLRRSLGIGLVGMVVAGVAFTVTEGIWQLTLVLIGAGTAELATWLSMQALASRAGRGESLRRHLALFSFAWGVGLAVGPIVGSALYATHGFASVAVFYCVMSAVGLLAALVVPTVGVECHEGPASSMRHAVTTMWGSPAVRAVLLSSFVILFVYGIRNSFYPLLLERRGMPVEQIGLLMSVIGIASLVVRLPLPRLVDRVGPERLLVVSMWVAVVAMTATPWLSTTALLVVAAILVGAGLGVNPPVTVEMMAVHTAAQERALAMGLRVSANRLSQMVQPVMFGVIAGFVGIPLAFAASGVLLAGLTAATRPRAAE